ncbi:hypothetical protein Q0Z83_082350 [Actinoplanes sichuanensis]|uniref:Uncharacterized protein n=1 Tax=Actinoplanes sichuanensis TaxID=512349 RepID=A0ABW4ACV0_9ACTN|nr:hypothetical protein [Actinoplanes sichuanensis]BEL10044.1 hypothetical protein Q0Z83_082350 [Actinoplanes sichuanensis]
MPRTGETAIEYARRVAARHAGDLFIVRRMTLTTAIIARAHEIGMPRDRWLPVLDAAQRRAHREWSR